MLPYMLANSDVYHLEALGLKTLSLRTQPKNKLRRQPLGRLMGNFVATSVAASSHH